MNNTKLLVTAFAAAAFSISNAYAADDKTNAADAKPNMEKCKAEMIGLASSGFRDTTRIASGNIQMGQDMFLTNKEAVLEMIDKFKASLTKLEEMIKSGDAVKITDELEKAKKLRDSMYAA